ncbi:uncharacterized protein JCM15063_000339 [Sporobolomyces koalae]|uniref:uncharacterized protein n=1 Tax=Sporobolomyces koalae TaxID=500713 RepID=UPI003171E821
MSTRLLLFAFISSFFLAPTLAHYSAGNQQRHQHYARQLDTPTYEPLHRRSATPTVPHTATPSLARRSASPAVSRRDALQRRHDFESYLHRRGVPSAVPSGMLNRRGVPSAVPSGMLNRRGVPSALPSSRKRGVDEQSNLEIVHMLAKERKTFKERQELEAFFTETNAQRIKRGLHPLPPHGFELREAGGTIRYLPAQSEEVHPAADMTYRQEGISLVGPSPMAGSEPAEATQQTATRTQGETHFKASIPNLDRTLDPSS